MSRQVVANLTHTWEKKDHPLSLTTKLLEEDRIISGILLEQNVVDVAQGTRLGEQEEALSNDIASLEASLKQKCEELKMVKKERALFLKDKKKKDGRYTFIHRLMWKRQLYVAEQKMGDQPQPLGEEDEEFIENTRKRLLRIHGADPDNTPDLQVLEEWERLRYSTTV
jgi:hypothetical protein